MDLAPHRSLLRHLTRTDPDPRVRHRADALLLVAGGLSLTQAGQQVGCSRNSVHTWAERFVTKGRAGLVDRRRLGRPPKLDWTPPHARCLRPPLTPYRWRMAIP